jgi:hypothetical protein
MSELQRLKGLLPPEMQSWVFVEAAASADPPLITIEEIGRDEVEIQLDLQKWDLLALDHRNLLFWHEVGRIQNDAVPRDGWEMAALAIGLGGAIGELWVQDGLLLVMALGLSGFAGYRLGRSIWPAASATPCPTPTRAWAVPSRNWWSRAARRKSAGSTKIGWRRCARVPVRPGLRWLSNRGPVNP